MVKPLKDYATLAKKARKAGLAKFDSRNLTPAQKGYLTKLENSHKAILDNPEKYFKRKIGDDTKRLLKKSEHNVIAGKVFIRKDGFTELHIKKTSTGIVIQRKSKQKQVKSRIHKDPLYIFKEIDRLEKRLKSIGYDSNEPSPGPYRSFGAVFSNGQPFYQSYDTIEDLKVMLNEYLKKRGQGLLMYLSLITYTWDEDDE